MEKEKCKYCEASKKREPLIVENYNKKEAKKYAEHLKHKHQ